MSHNALTAKIALIATRAVRVVAEEVRDSFENLHRVAPTHIDQAEAVAAKLVVFLEQAHTDKVNPGVAREQVLCATNSLAEVSESAQAKVAAAAIDRVQRALAKAGIAGVAFSEIGR